MKKQLIKRIEELSVENDRLKNELTGKSITMDGIISKWDIKETQSEIDYLKSMIDPKVEQKEEEEIWWWCTKKNFDINFTERKKYKQTATGFNYLTLINDKGDKQIIYGYNNYFTEVEVNNELEEAIEVMNGWLRQAPSTQLQLSGNERDSVETILKHLE